MARAFRNGITLDDRPKNKGVMAYLVKLEIFGEKNFGIGATDELRCENFQF